MHSTLLIAVAVAAAAGLVLFLTRSACKQDAGVFSPRNDLERLLLASVGTADLTADARRVLASSTLCTLESDEAPNVPMSFSATFPAEFADALDGHEAAEDGTIRFGPFIICFSSTGMAAELAADPVLGGVLTQVGNVREYPAQMVFRSSIERQLDVVLNPFCGVTRRFSQDESRLILQDVTDSL